jgi:hypothetical protein
MNVTDEEVDQRKGELTIVNILPYIKEMDVNDEMTADRG